MAKIAPIEKRESVNLSLPTSLIAAIDELASAYGSNRSRVVESLVLQDLEVTGVIKRIREEKANAEKDSE